MEVIARSITNFSTNIEACTGVELDVSHFHIRGLCEGAVFIWVSVDMGHVMWDVFLSTRDGTLRRDLVWVKPEKLRVQVFRMRSPIAVEGSFLSQYSILNFHQSGSHL